MIEQRLVSFDSSAAATVVAWCAASPFSSEWVPDSLAPDAVLAGWHTDPDITGHLLLRGGAPVAYGELWVEEGDDEAELAHLVVEPALRRLGLGRALAVELVALARARGWPTSSSVSAPTTRRRSPATARPASSG